MRPLYWTRANLYNPNPTLTLTLTLTPITRTRTRTRTLTRSPGGMRARYGRPVRCLSRQATARWSWRWTWEATWERRPLRRVTCRPLLVCWSDPVQASDPVQGDKTGK